MAILKFGSIVTEGSGSLGGHTIQKSFGGSQLRNKPIPRGNPSASQTLIRSYNNTLQQGWKALTSDQQKVWNEWAITHNICNKSGDRHPLSGHSLWMKINFSNLYTGNPIWHQPWGDDSVPSLISNWINSLILPFVIFDTSGSNINSAIVVSDVGVGYGAPLFSIVTGETYQFDMNLILNSGSAPRMVFTDINVTVPYSNYIDSVPGTHSYIFDIISTKPNSGLFIFSAIPTNFSANSVSLIKL